MQYLKLKQQNGLPQGQQNAYQKIKIVIISFTCLHLFSTWLAAFYPATMLPGFPGVFHLSANNPYGGGGRGSVTCLWEPLQFVATEWIGTI